MATSTESESTTAGIAWSFLVGALAMLTFHQSAAGLFHAAGMFVVAPFDLELRGPLRLPGVLVGAFWSGVWGVVFLWLCLPRLRRRMPGWVAGLLFGFLVPVAFLFYVVAPLKGQPLAFDQDWGSMLRIALAHAFWGLGMVLIDDGLKAARAERA